jgi:hypothetical protein
VLTVGLSLKVHSPCAFVVAAGPEGENALSSKGNGFSSTETGRLALFEPLSFPESVTAAPNLTVVGVALIVMFLGSGLAAWTAGAASAASAAKVMIVLFMPLATHEPP